MDDLVKELRSLADCDARAGEPLGNAMRKAADAIEGLEKEVAKLRQDNMHLRHLLIPSRFGPLVIHERETK